MPPIQRDITEAELSVLRVLWQDGRLTAREIADRLYPEGGQTGYATVKKLLERLEEKGAARRDRRASPHRYSARVDRKDLIERRLRDLAEDLCDGSLAPVLTHLVEGQRLSAADRQLLQRLIDDPGESGRG